MAPRNPLSDLFGRSPIGPIQKHMQAVDQAAQFLPDLFRASANDDWDEASRLHKEIVCIERAADKLKRSVRRHLPKSLFLPVPRTDLLELVAIQDRVANGAKDIAGLVMGRGMRFPEKLQGIVVEFAEVCAATSRQALRAIQELDELLEVGFTGREVRLVEGILKELDKLERSTDKLAAKLRDKLFKMEAELSPIDAVFNYQVIAMLGSIADDAECVGDRLQMLMAR